ncbi:MAG: MAPEG family protein [Notoacmeibacter sp.]|nr:MAPEG family protein [Notoacmeibacter sp.]MCC0032013.1 MAPEG family protein [Brucellaceae bacterium]
MNPTAIFWPMLAQVALVYFIYYLMSKRRIDAVKSGQVRVDQFRDNQIQNEPTASLFVRNNLANQYELPVLFYACVLSLHASGGVNVVTLVLAWLFVATRYAHAFIHVTSNRVRRRRMLFIMGFLILGVMWIAFALHLVGIM